MPNPSLADAYGYCYQLANSHYENFPIASRLLKKNLRQAISVIYAFARTADDFADEGDLSTEQRHSLLAQYSKQIKQIENGDINTAENWLNAPIFITLADVKEQYQLDLALFQQLICAFQQDVDKTNYQSFEQLITYCQSSANPVGRILLQLNQQNSERNNILSDHICSALQLINFLQDYQQDIIENQRLYIPINDLNELQIDVDEILDAIKKGKSFTPNYQTLYQQQLLRAEQLLLSGKPLINNLSGRFKYEIKLIYLAAVATLDKLKAVNAFSQRPRLSKADKVLLLAKVLAPKSF